MKSLKYLINPLRQIHKSSKKYQKIHISYLVGGLEHFFHFFPYIGNVIIPTVGAEFFFTSKDLSES